MWYSVSNTAEYGGLTRGDVLVDADVRKRMEKMLKDIQSGAFADRWIAVQEAGGDEFRELRARDRGHQIEQVGADLRSKLQFLNPIVVEAGAAQASTSKAGEARK